MLSEEYLIFKMCPSESSAYTLHSSPIPQQMVQMAFCDLLHTFQKQVKNRFLTSPLNFTHLLAGGGGMAVVHSRVMVLTTMCS